MDFYAAQTGTARRKRRLSLAVLSLGLFLVFLFSAVWGAVASLKEGLPATFGRLDVPGLSAPVTVYRDDYGVPHIVARNDADLFFAQGFVQAQDRLWQMDLTRRAVSGRLAEIFGESMLEADAFLRTIGFRRTAMESLAVIEPEVRDALESFAAGVNAYLAAIEQGEAPLPPEFRILRYRPDPWTPPDSTAIAKYMAWDLGGNWRAELFRFALMNRVGEEKARQLFPTYPAEAPTVIPRETIRVAAGLPDEATRGLPALASMPGATLSPTFGRSPGVGSNNWVISGELTASGKPLLANYPHLAIGLPSIWYEMHLFVPGSLNVAGVVFPGAPGIVLGHNERIAWGMTNLGPDVQDLYIEKFDPSDPRRYEYEGKWYAAKIVKESIAVKGKKEPAEIEIRYTRHGPVISSLVEGVEVPLSLRWTAHDVTRELEAVLAINRAGNWEEFREALRLFAAPAQNFVYADVDGNIGYRGNGRIPIRRNGEGLVPVPGWVDDYEWDGYIPWDELPELFNPEEGFIATANNKVVGDDYPYFLTSEWEAPYRAVRIREVLKDILRGKKGITVEDAAALQNDWYNVQARQLVPVLVRHLKKGAAEETLARSAAQSAGGEPWSAIEEKALEILKEWGSEPVEASDLPGPAIYNAFYVNLLEAIYQDEMGEVIFRQFLDHGSPELVLDPLLKRDLESEWFDDVSTPERTEGLTDMVVAAFRKAVGELARTQGSTPETWEWGGMHTITFAHPLGAVKPLDLLFNVGPFPAGGGKYTVVRASYPLTRPFDVNVAAPWRFVVDLADLNNAASVNVPGQSGHPGSPHYDDQVDLWQAGRNHSLFFNLDDLETLPGVLVLDPLTNH